MVSLAAMVLLASGFDDWMFVNPVVARGLGGFGLGMVCWTLWERGGLRARWTGMPSRLADALEVLALAWVAAVPALLLPIPLADLVFAFLVLAFAADRGIVSRLLATWPFVWVGVLSYSIYLVHLLVILVANWVVAAMPAGVSNLAPVAGLAVFPATIAVAWVTWRLVEAPAREWSRRRATAMGAGPEERVAPTI